MLPEEYTCRCDKHSMKPYVYCEMCWMRTRVQDVVETMRKETGHIVGSANVMMAELHDTVSALRKRIMDLEIKVNNDRNQL